MPTPEQRAFVGSILLKHYRPGVRDELIEILLRETKTPEELQKWYEDARAFGFRACKRLCQEAHEQSLRCGDH